MSKDIDERCWWCSEDLEGQVLADHIKKHPVTEFEAKVANMVSVADCCDHFCCGLSDNVCRVRTLAREIKRESKFVRSEVLAACATLAANPYDDEVAALAGDEPGCVGHKIANAILALQPAASALEALLREEREKYLGELCASVCPLCADQQKYDLHGDEQGYWCHTEKGVSHTWENKKCAARGFREVSRQLDLTQEGSKERK